MAKIIVSCRFRKSAKDTADLIRYMATREGVEKLPSGEKYNLAKEKYDSPQRAFCVARYTARLSPTGIIDMYSYF